MFDDQQISIIIQLMQREFIQKLTNLVEAKLENERFGLEDLARDVCMSHTHLNRKLKKNQQ